MSTIKPRTKTIITLIIGMILGAFFAYAFMWWQVYQKFNVVYTCQIFTGALSIEQSKMCEKFDPNNKPKYY